MFYVSNATVRKRRDCRRFDVAGCNSLGRIIMEYENAFVRGIGQCNIAVRQQCQLLRESEGRGHDEFEAVAIGMDDITITVLTRFTYVFIKVERVVK